MIKLSFSEIVSQSFRFFFNNLPLFFHLVTVPWVLSVAIRVVGALLMSDDDVVLAALVEKLLDIVPTTMFLVAWLRFALLGANRIEGLPGVTWGRRETNFLIHLVQVGGITYVLVATLMLMLGTMDPAVLRAGTDPEVVKRQALAAPIGMGFIISMVLALRVSWGLAASAVDVPFSPRLSWAHGRGNGWTVIGSLFLILFTSAIVTTVLALFVVAILRGMVGGGLGPAVVAWTVAILASYGGTAVAATAIAIIFRTLTGWREGQALKQIPEKAD
jgi:hypothetical protein